MHVCEALTAPPLRTNSHLLTPFGKVQASPQVDVNEAPFLNLAPQTFGLAASACKQLLGDLAVAPHHTQACDAMDSRCVMRSVICIWCVSHPIPSSGAAASMTCRHYSQIRLAVTAFRCQANPARKNNVSTRTCGRHNADCYVGCCVVPRKTLRPSL